ncbi:EscV/YscV/HrcV family type III secretion system export apparatus protein [Stenotrophomonas oahuensis]|uniref:EscV/YscV/HrcV family type III secretion system export apparatus protein n=1 Tax=Stenotrophomonas oahuensis TaxID=3003271 RepID=A0ABY9YQK6_9GAMM|nr:EscV/YscV/HrcV family type III secretion system export apparatus protein [Stenotrophomonas sp. A5586]WNH52968.1 EscV/YscV/HrcV family type III secretion system export apparatus protein [Stenotrophomonas sp. A5586]
MSAALNSGSLSARVRGMLRPELALVVLMAVVVAMLIIPLPTLVVDLLIALNMAVAIVIFLSSFYVERILSFSTFPSVLLFTTLMRLALSVSTSRLILVDADAGHIINAFGEFVVADNLVVGAVIFAIITLVQFIVITKGSERIGEVVARFSLDGMPGKQMSIDADLRAEAITSEEAQRRRRDVERESQLYGSYDGAMKFVKGDAIAGIVIVFVNLFGGIAVGMLQHGMPFGEALNTFTLLTIGDGLVAQIPALLICISAGFIVTRVSGEDNNLGASILGELFNSNVVLAIGAILILLMGFLPGFPLPVFAGLAMGLAAMLFWRMRRGSTAESASGTGATGTAGAAASADASGNSSGNLTSETLPLILLLPGPLHEAATAGKWEEQLRNDAFINTGMQLAAFVLRQHEPTQEHQVKVLINEIPAASGQVVGGHVRVLGRQDELDALNMGLTVPHEGAVARWVPAASQADVLAMGCEVATDYEELRRLVHGAVLRNVGELFGIQEAKHVLDALEKRFPELVKEAYRHMPIQRVAEVLQRLLREDVSIRNMKVVLETLAQWGQREKDVILLVEHVRSALARYISARFARDGRIPAILVSSQVEDQIRSGIRQSQGAAYLNLEPTESNELMDRFALHVGEVSVYRPDVVLMVAPDIRRFVKRFIENKLPSTPVLSFGEISDAVTLDVMRSI